MWGVRVEREWECGWVVEWVWKGGMGPLVGRCPWWLWWASE